MTGRELIELAARAAGYKVIHSFENNDSLMIEVSERKYEVFNPLTSDADAFRLAVKLGIFTRKDFVALLAILMGSGMPHDDAARMAVCQISGKIAGMAAAEIGRGMV